MIDKVLAASTLALVMLCLPAGVVLAQSAGQGTQVAQGADAGAAADQGANTGTAAAPPAQGNGAEAAASQLQEVVVTAERRTQDLQATPIAIQAISGDTLRSQQVNIITNLSLVAPSFQDESPDNWLGSFDIRGVGASVAAENTEQGVSILRDGMYMSESVANDEPFFDLADVEVLEGPQGTLIGANALGGAIEINSANPNFKGLNGYVEGQLGNYSDRMFQGAVNLPVSDNFAMRLAFYDQQEGSFWKDIGATPAGYFVNASGDIQLMNDSPGADGNPNIDPGQINEQAARLSLLWQPTDNFQAIGKAEYFTDANGGLPLEPELGTYQTLFGAGRGPTYTGCTTQSAAINYAGASGTQLICSAPGSIQHNTYSYPGEQPFVLDYYGQEMYYNETQYHFTLQLNYTLPDGVVLRSQSAANHIDISQQNNVSYGPDNAGAQKIITGPNDDYLSQEFDLISPTSGKLNWIGGTYWYYRNTSQTAWEDEVTSPYQPNQLPSVLVLEQGSGALRMAAVFGQINWQFTDTLQLQFGARENWDANYEYNQVPAAPAPGTTLKEPSGTGVYSINYPTGCVASSGGCVATSYTSLAPISEQYPGNNVSDRAPTGKIDLNWVPTPGQNFYVFYARGYKSGGANGGSTQFPSFKPETLNDWELGWKGQLLDGRMRTQLGAYYYDYQHMQIQVEDTQYEDDTSISSINGNIQGDSVLYGLTAAEQARFGGLGVNVNFSWEHTKLGTLSALNANALPPGWGSPVAIPQCVPGHSYTGDCFNYTPYETTLSGEQMPFAPTLTGNASVDYNIPVGHGVIDPRVTYTYTSGQWASVYEMGAYDYMGVRDIWNATVDFVFGHWDTQLYVDNFTNEVYLIANGGIEAQSYWGNPRQLGIQSTYRF